MRLSRLFICILVAILTVVLSFIWSQLTKPSSSFMPIGSSTSSIYYTKEGGRLTEILRLPDEAWTRVDRQDYMSFGYQKAPLWLHVTTKRPLASNLALVLDYPLLDDVEFFQISQKRQIAYLHTGDEVSLVSKTQPTTHFLFPLKAADAGLDVYIRIKTSGSVKVPLYVEGINDNKARSLVSIFFIGGYTGYMFLTFLLGWIVFSVTREKTYVIYSLYSAFLLLLNLHINGFLFQWGWPLLPQINNSFTVFLLYGTILFQLLFVESYLTVDHKWQSSASFLIKILCIAGIFSTWVRELYFYVSFLGVFLLLASNVFLTTLAYTKKKKQRGMGRDSFYFRLALIFILIGVFICTLGFTGILKSLPVVNNAVMIASVFEVFFFTCALVERFGEEKEARLSATLKGLAESKQRVITEKKLVFQATHDRNSNLPKKEILFQNWPELQKSFTSQDTVYATLVHFENYYKQVLAFGQDIAEDSIHCLHERIRNLVKNNPRFAIIDFGWERDKAAVLDSLDVCLILVLQKGEDANTLLLSMYESLNKPVQHGELDLEVDISIGISIYNHQETIQALIRRAQVASQEASQRRLPLLHYTDTKGYDPEYTGVLMAKLNANLQKGNLEVYFQPQIDSRNGELHGVEALLRWYDEESNIWQQPDVFIPLVEQSSLIAPMTEFVLKKSFLFFNEFKQHFGYATHVSINLSARNLVDRGMVSFISLSLDEYNIPPEYITLEITETALLGDLESSKKAFNNLLSLGVKVALDDFGTGYSSLMYLKELSFSELKIDKSFLLNKNNLERNRSLIKATVQLGRELGMLVVAEGVEDKEIIIQLNEIGCYICQGYFYSKALPTKRLFEWLEAMESKRTISG